MKKILQTLFISTLFILAFLIITGGTAWCDNTVYGTNATATGWTNRKNRERIERIGSVYFLNMEVFPF